MSNRRVVSRAAKSAAVFVLGVFAVACGGSDPAPAATAPAAPVDPARAAIEKRIARAKALELPTQYEPVPGDALSHHTSGYAKTGFYFNYYYCKYSRYN